MVKITFLGAGSTVFARNVLGDCMCTPVLRDAEIALYDIDGERLKDSEIILKAINHNVNEDRAVIKTYLGVENRKEALHHARTPYHSRNGRLCKGYGRGLPQHPFPELH